MKTSNSNNNYTNTTSDTLNESSYISDVHEGTHVDIIIITHENVGEKMAGPGIRAWEISRCLGLNGFKVRLATPYPSERIAKNVVIQMFSWDDPVTLLRLIENSKVVYSTGPVITRICHILRRPLDKPTIIDLYDIVELERIMHSVVTQNFKNDITHVVVDELFTYMRQGDYFVCSSERQLDYWTGVLMAVGRINRKTLGVDFSIDDLLDIVPMGMQENPPQANKPFFRGKVDGIDDNDKLLYWGGGVWDWTDPFTLLDALDIIIKKREDIRLVFGALHHFDTNIVPRMSSAARLREYVEQKGWLNKFVFFGEWIPYDLRGSLLLEVDVGVSLNAYSLESKYAARARLLDYWWADLPCVISKGDLISEKLHDVGLAKLVLPGDSKALANEILEILSHQRYKNQIVGQKEKYFWLQIIKPIIEFINNPRKAKDSDAARMRFQSALSLRREWEIMRDKVTDLEGKLNEITDSHTELILNREETISRINSLSNERDDLLEQIHSLQNAKDEMKSNLRKMSNEFEKLMLKNDLVQKERDELLDNRNTLRKNIENLKSDNHILISKNSSLRHAMLLERERLRTEMVRTETELKHQINLYRQRKVVRFADMVVRIFKRK